MAITAASLIAVVSVEGALESVTKLQEVGAASNEAGLKMGGLLAAGALIGGAALLALGAKSVQMAADFQQGMTTLVTGAGELATNMGIVRDGILGIAVSTGTATDSLIKAMFQIESAGFRGRDGLNILTVAAQGAKVGESDLVATTDVLLTAMHNYHIPFNQATGVMNLLIVAVQNGRMTMSALNDSLVKVLPVASALKVPFADVTGALDVMAMSGDKGAVAGTHLAMMFKALAQPMGPAAKEMAAMGINTVDLAQTMRTSLPNALQMIQNAVAQHFVPGSVEYNRAIATILGGSKSGIAGLEILGSGMKLLRADTAAAADALRHGGGAVQGWALVQEDFNQKMSVAREVVETLGIKIGTALLPTLSNILGLLPGVVGYFSDFSAHSQVLIPVMAGLGAVIATLLVPAVWALASGVIAATWPFLLIGAAVAGAVAIFMHFYQTSAPFKAFIDTIVSSLKQAAAFVQANFAPAMAQIGAVLSRVGAFVQTNFLPAFAQMSAIFKGSVMPVLAQVADFLRGLFLPVWQQLVALWQGTLLPALKQLQGAFAPLMPIFMSMLPVLKLIGMVILGVVVVAFGGLVGVLKGVVTALAGFLGGVITIIGGVIQMFVGVEQIIAGVVRFIFDLFTGNFGKLKGDLGTIWQGIINIFTGAGNVMKGLFQALWGTLSGFVSGFVSGIIGFFTGLSRALVGHSIIPDMINGIIQWFLQLPGRVGAAINAMVSAVVSICTSLRAQIISIVTSLVNQFVSNLSTLIGRAQSAMNSVRSAILGVLNGMIGAALSAGANIVNAIANGIRGAIGNVAGAIGSVVSFIASHLPHSPAKIGPLRDLPIMGAQITEQIGQGMVAGLPKLQTSLNMVLSPIAMTPRAVGGVGSGLSSAAQPITVNVYLDGAPVAKKLLPHLAQQIRQATGAKG